MQRAAQEKWMHVSTKQSFTSLSVCISVCSIASCLSWVPEKGTVGASGDLAPLAHLALGLMGEGRMWSPQSSWADAKAVSFIYSSSLS